MFKSHSSIYLKRHSYTLDVSVVAPVPILKIEKTNFEGRAVNTSKFVLDEPCKRYSGLKAVDFALENQQQVGFEGKPVFYNPSQFAIEEHVKSSLSHGRKEN